MTFTHGPTVQLSREMLDDSAYDWSRFISGEIHEAMLDMERPRFGPRRVLNDVQQADLERRQELAEVLFDLAEELGVTDLVVRVEY